MFLRWVWLYFLSLDINWDEWEEKKPEFEEKKKTLKKEKKAKRNKRKLVEEEEEMKDPEFDVWTS